MYTHNHVQYHTHTCWLIVSEKPGFSPSAFLIRHHTPLNERLLVSDYILILFISRLGSHSLQKKEKKEKRNNTSPISVCTFLLFPRQQWQKILPRRTQPMALAVVWVVVLLGSVELAASVCACFRLVSLCGGPMGGSCMYTYALMHTRLHTFVQEKTAMSAV